MIHVRNLGQRRCGNEGCTQFVVAKSIRTEVSGARAVVVVVCPKCDRRKRKGLFG